MPKSTNHLSQIERFKRMFGADTARIWTGVVTDKKFLIIGQKRNTEQDETHWYRGGIRHDFPYVAEQVVASGRTNQELAASAREYKRLLRGRSPFLVAESFG